MVSGRWQKISRPSVWLATATSYCRLLKSASNWINSLGIPFETATGQNPLVPLKSPCGTGAETISFNMSHSILLEIAAHGQIQFSKGANGHEEPMKIWRRKY
jgi:hypothetical protein